MEIFFYNTLSKKKEKFIPLKKKNIRMYVCGPTVYEQPHIGNMRSVIVYDILYRLLRGVYGEDSITYVRNITDVDDKIINRAISENKHESEVAKAVEESFWNSSDKLNCLKPNISPRATEEIDIMIDTIDRMINNGIAYQSEGHVLLDVKKVKDYGILSNRKIDEMIECQRIESASYKKDQMDFVLWKPSNNDKEISWDTKFGKGRPGWHTECVAMSTKYLGEEFDIHGGGVDLVFPHHENEMAQANACGYKFAKYWIHNGFLMFNGEKMSKSLGNIKTLDDLLSAGYTANAVRYALISTKYNKPIDLSDNLLRNSMNIVEKFMNAIHDFDDQNEYPPKEIIEELGNDLNTTKCLSLLHSFYDNGRINDLFNGMKFLGFIIERQNPKIHIIEENFEIIIKDHQQNDINTLKDLLKKRSFAKKSKNFSESDSIRNQIILMGYEVSDTLDQQIITSK